MIEQTKRRVVTLALAAALLGVAACASSPRGERVYVGEAPPVERVEVIGAAPGPSYVWVPGRWNKSVPQPRHNAPARPIVARARCVCGASDHYVTRASSLLNPPHRVHA